jgi:hypothetical protein
MNAAFQRGYDEGFLQALQTFYAWIDAYPNAPGDITLESLGEGAVMHKTEFAQALGQLAGRIRVAQDGRRQRRKKEEKDVEEHALRAV